MSKQFGIRLKAKRLAEKLSVRDLAAKLGISPATVSRVERRNACSGDTLVKLHEWMGTKNPLAEEDRAAKRERLIEQFIVAYGPTELRDYYSAKDVAESIAQIRPLAEKFADAMMGEEK